MAKAVVDPGELRRFAQDLKKFSTDLQQQTGALNARMATLAQTWRDQEQAKFSEEFEQQLGQFGRFVESTGEYVPYLIRKAERIEEYQQQR